MSKCEVRTTQTWLDLIFLWDPFWHICRGIRGWDLGIGRFLFTYRFISSRSWGGCLNAPWNSFLQNMQFFIYFSYVIVVVAYFDVSVCVVNSVFLIFGVWITLFTIMSCIHLLLLHTTFSKYRKCKLNLFIVNFFLIYMSKTLSTIVYFPHG